MLNASVGVQRVIGRLRRPSIDSIAAMTLPASLRVTPRPHRVRVAPRAIPPRRYPMARRRGRRLSLSFGLPSLASLRFSGRSLRALPLRRAFNILGHERILGVSVAGIVLAASFLSVTPGRPSGDIGGPNGDGPSSRLAVGGSGDNDDVGSVVEAYARPPDRAYDVESGTAVEQPQNLATTEAVSIEGPFLDDGTLLKPVAVDTSVPDGSALMRTYRVKAGDTLATIAARFDVTTMTLWWANDLKAKNRLVVGQKLIVPPVSGLVIEVRASDTLAALANRHKVSADEILATNGLKDRHLVVGQVLMLPGARGAGIVTPKPRPKSSTPSRPSRSNPTVRPPRTYNGGRFGWPTSSRHISQYYHYGHYAIDVDGSTGDPIWSAASGTVIFAGWKNNGGGYQVWISHGSNLYTTYNHMSSVAVGRGQSVGRGQRIGRMGSSGYATGSHLHFEVWRGAVWSGGSRVNPLAYL